ncbi:MAG TPA: glycosyltransferase family 4 protein [Isosphaeraceae bacterium]|nr:glycosyltransferase family 4 protein [Isosphaeraceae bacterium]
MAEPTRNVLLLAGHLGEHDDGWPIGALLERLARRGIAAQVLCVARAAGARADYRVVEDPGLGHRWWRPLAVRRLRFGEGLKRPDLIHAIHREMGPAALAIAEHWQIPYLLTIQEFLPSRGRLRLSRRWCRRLIATSRDLALDLARSLDVPAHFLSVVNQGVMDVGGGARTRKAGQVPVIGAAGALEPDSGFATFLNAARRVLDAGVDAEFMIAGAGEGEVDLRRRAKRLRIADRVTFTTHSLVGSRFWSVLDLYCQTTLVPTVGRTLAIAQSFGVPSIASDVEGLRALVAHDETGLRVTPGDSTALARTILALLADPERARSLGRRGRESVRRDFDPEAEAHGLATVYRRVLGPSAPRPAPVARGAEVISPA